MSIGFRIFTERKRPSAVLVQSFESVVTPHVSDNMSRLTGTTNKIIPFHNGKKLVGTALTVKTRPGDNLLVHKAIDMAEPGDVIVVDAGGDTTNAIIGEIMMRLAIKKQINGFIIDGAIRDSKAFKEEDYPVYARGITHRGPYKDGPGEINVSVTIDGMRVEPGDIVLGDEDGLVAIPLKEAQEILELVRLQSRKENQIFEEIEEGSHNRKWVDQTLIAKGCEVI